MIIILYEAINIWKNYNRLPRTKLNEIIGSKLINVPRQRNTPISFESNPVKLFQKYCDASRDRRGKLTEIFCEKTEISFNFPRTKFKRKLKQEEELIEATMMVVFRGALKSKTHN